MTADWYYVGHYGQIGPLTQEQIEELVRDTVIQRDTYVWRAGMADWIPAERVPELASVFAASQPPSVPPPPPFPAPSGTPAPPTSAYEGATPYGRGPVYSSTPGAIYANLPKSDRLRWVAGVLQLLIPGVGRFYLGYPAHGLLQLLLAPCIVGLVWSFIDGIVILAGGLKLDGHGRFMSE